MHRDERVLGVWTPGTQSLRVTVQAGVGVLYNVTAQGVTHALPDKVIGSPSWAWDERGFFGLWLPLWSDRHFCESPGGVT